MRLQQNKRGIFVILSIDGVQIFNGIFFWAFGDSLGQHNETSFLKFWWIHFHRINLKGMNCDLYLLMIQYFLCRIIDVCTALSGSSRLVTSSAHNASLHFIYI
jgi:hypothetical protein